MPNINSCSPIRWWEEYRMNLCLVAPGMCAGELKRRLILNGEGKNANGSEGFADERDPIDFGSTPIHQLMVENGVSAYFHGHDHQYVYEKTDDGIVYQEMPSLGMSGFAGIYEEGDHGTFETIKILPSPAHLLITVSPSMTTVDYIPDSSTSGEATYSYTILPSSEDTTSPTVTIEQADGQTDPTSASSVNFDVTFSESVSDFATGDVTLSGSAGATAAEVSGSGTAYNVESQRYDHFRHGNRRRCGCCSA